MAQVTTTTITTNMRIFFIGLVMIVSSFCLNPTSSVILPPRFYSSRPDTPPDTTANSSSAGCHNSSVNADCESDNLSYLLSINEGDSIDVKINTNSFVTINLNRPVPEDVTVTLIVYSGPGLIIFDDDIPPPPNSSYHPSIREVVFVANTFGDKAVKFHTTNAAGHAEIVSKVTKQPESIIIDDSSAYISINIGKSWQLNIIIHIVGWIYFLAWSLSFYFQVILNYQRKSVVGLNFDFLALNLVGFTFYSIYNLTMLFSREVQMDYYERNTYSRIPVEYNDLFFALHAFVLTLITVIQCFIYERGEQKVSLATGFFIGLASTIGFCLYICNLFEKLAILDLVLYLSYVKLAITIIKYSPQLYMNYKRKATTGWSIHNILLDFTGGILSLAQMFFLAYNYDDWISIFGNFTKFGLGIISISFDLLFVLQHYVLYKQVGEIEPSSEDYPVPSPVISQSVRSSSYRPTDDQNSIHSEQ